MKIETVIDVIRTFIVQEEHKENNPDFNEVLSSLNSCYDNIKEWKS